MNFSWPILPAPRSTRGQLFTAKMPSGKPHNALDMGTGGQVVLAPAAGTVAVSAMTRDSRGRVIHINHDEGYQTRYYHLGGSYVRAGQTVSQGEQIAVVGRTGLPKNNPHLHFMVYANCNGTATCSSGYPIDPQGVLPPRESFSGEILYAIQRPWHAPSMYNDLFGPPIGRGSIRVADASYMSRQRPRARVFLGAETLLYESEPMGPGLRARRALAQDDWISPEEAELAEQLESEFSEDLDDIFNEGDFIEDDGSDGFMADSGTLIGIVLLGLGLYVFWRH